MSVSRSEGARSGETGLPAGAGFWDRPERRRELDRELREMLHFRRRVPGRSARKGLARLMLRYNRRRQLTEPNPVPADTRPAFILVVEDDREQRETLCA